MIYQANPFVCILVFFSEKSQPVWISYGWSMDVSAHPYPGEISDPTEQVGDTWAQPGNDLISGEFWWIMIWIMNNYDL